MSLFSNLFRFRAGRSPAARHHDAVCNMIDDLSAESEYLAERIRLLRQRQVELHLAIDALTAADVVFASRRDLPDDADDDARETPLIPVKRDEETMDPLAEELQQVLRSCFDPRNAAEIEAPMAGRLVPRPL